METTSYRVIAIYGGRECVAARGLTKEAAEAKLAEFRAKPLRGMSYCLESEPQARQWEQWREAAQVEKVHGW